MTTDFAGNNDWAYAVAIQGDGKIVAAGRADLPGYDFALVRYNIDGSPDTTFSGDGKITTDFAGSTDGARAVAIQADGKIIAAGLTWPSTNYDFALARYNIDGSLDGTFGGDGRVTTDFAGGPDQAFAVAVQGAAWPESSSSWSPHSETVSPPRAGRSALSPTEAGTSSTNDTSNPKSWPKN